MRGDGLQVPLLIPVAAAIFAVSPREDQETILGSILKDVFTKGHHAELLPGTPVEAEVSQALDLSREEFGKLQSVTTGQVP